MHLTAVQCPPHRLRALEKPAYQVGDDGVMEGARLRVAPRRFRRDEMILDFPGLHPRAPHLYAGLSGGGVGRARRGKRRGGAVRRPASFIDFSVYFCCSSSILLIVAFGSVSTCPSAKSAACAPSRTAS